ncbi:MAG: DUF4292 domain-containing protein [Saprospiraceae bacterium]|nr:DUF4292 domain-containing protein [Saprospiraceae bacterium]
MRSSEVPSLATKVRSSDFLVKQLQQSELKELESLSAKARIYVEGNGSSIEANANLIWIRDSVVWLTVKKLGIEAFRALVTRDSVFVLDRLARTYTAGDIESLQHRYSLPEGFPLLQGLVLASAWLEPGMQLQSGIKDSLHRLSGNNNRFSADYRIEERSFFLRQETFMQQRDARILNLEFEQFKKLPGAGMFPYLRRIEAYSPESGNMRLDIEFTDVEVNVPKSYRFEIPTHYQRTE